MTVAWVYSVPLVTRCRLCNLIIYNLLFDLLYLNIVTYLLV